MRVDPGGGKAAPASRRLIRRRPMNAAERTEARGYSDVFLDGAKMAQEGGDLEHAQVLLEWALRLRKGRWDALTAARRFKETGEMPSNELQEKWTKRRRHCYAPQPQQPVYRGEGPAVRRTLLPTRTEIRRAIGHGRMTGTTRAHRSSRTSRSTSSTTSGEPSSEPPRPTRAVLRRWQAFCACEALGI